MWDTFKHNFQKTAQSKLNCRPMGKKSPNLVTLPSMQSRYRGSLKTQDMGIEQ
jgi:hypothetical protein